MVGLCYVRANAVVLDDLIFRVLRCSARDERVAVALEGQGVLADSAPPHI